MPTVTVPTEVTISAGRLLAITTNGKARVEIVSGTLGYGYTSYVVTSARERVMGPYGGDVVVRIRPYAGFSASYADRLLGQPASTEIDPVSGLSSGRVLLPNGKSAIVSPKNINKVAWLHWMSRRGVFDNVAATTHQATITLPRAPDGSNVVGIEVETFNPRSEFCPQFNSCSISNPLTLADLNNSGGVWTQITAKQNASWTVPQPPRPNSSGATETIMALDFLPYSPQPAEDGRTRVTIRVVAAANQGTAATGGLPVGGDATTAGNVGGDNYLNWATKPDGDIRVWRNQTGSFAGAGTQAGFNSTTNVSQSPIVGLRVTYDCGVIQHVTMTDSNGMAAGGTYRDDSSANMLANKLSGQNGLVHAHAQRSVSGKAGNGYFGFHQAQRDLLSDESIPINFLWSCRVSPNDCNPVITAAILRDADANCAKNARHANQRGAYMIFNDLAPVGRTVRNWSTDNTTPASDTLRVTHNAADKAKVNADYFIWSISDLVELTDDYNGQKQPVAQTGDQTRLALAIDQIHWSDALQKRGADAGEMFVIQRSVT